MAILNKILNKTVLNDFAHNANTLQTLIHSVKSAVSQNFNWAIRRCRQRDLKQISKDGLPVQTKALGQHLTAFPSRQEMMRTDTAYSLTSIYVH